MKQKSSDLRKIVQTALERTSKKYDLQLRQLKDTEKREKFKVYGELTQTYGYGLEPNAKSLTCMNYYTNEEITIPLDPTKTPLENSKKFFAKYNKLKRTYEALSELVVETKADLDHLDSISTALSLSEDEKDLQLIKDELSDYGYIKSHGKKKGKKQAKSKPLHFISSDGFHMYVGKNNYQNDELSFKFANGGDWWFHAKICLVHMSLFVKSRQKHFQMQHLKKLVVLRLIILRAVRHRRLRSIMFREKNFGNRRKQNLDLSFIIQLFYDVCSEY